MNYQAANRMNFKDFFSISMLIIASLFIGSCAESKQNDTDKKEKESPEGPIKTVEYSEFKISNKDQEYFKVPDEGEVKVKINEDGYISMVFELELVKTYPGRLGKGEVEQAFISLQALDEEGLPMVLGSHVGKDINSVDSLGRKFTQFLKSDSGKTQKFNFIANSAPNGEISSANKEENIKAAKKISGFKIITNGL